MIFFSAWHGFLANHSQNTTKIKFVIINKMSNTNTAIELSKVDLGLLEEDDEFEEFPSEDWATMDEDEEECNVWDDNWDDDNIEDDFRKQLETQVEAKGTDVKKTFQTAQQLLRK